MEKAVTLLIPALFALLFVRMLTLPLRRGIKLTAHTLCGLVCLWLINAAAPFTGILIPVNAVTVAVAGFGGLPGIGLIALLAVL